MSESSTAPDERKQARLDRPTGWLRLTKDRSVGLIVDTLLSAPPHREFTQTELAEFAGVSRQTVATHLDMLCELEVLEECPNTSPTRYRMPTSEVADLIVELNGALNATGLRNREDTGIENSDGES
jgi:hypothetical protein